MIDPTVGGLVCVAAGWGLSQAAQWWRRRGDGAAATNRTAERVEREVLPWFDAPGPGEDFEPIPAQLRRNTLEVQQLRHDLTQHMAEEEAALTSRGDWERRIEEQLADGAREFARLTEAVNRQAKDNHQ